MRLWILVFVALLFNGVFAATYVAVAEVSATDEFLDRSEKMFVTDKLRERFQTLLPVEKNFVIMTRENVAALQPLEAAVENMDGKSLVEAGRLVKADFIIGARVGKFANDLTMTVEVYEVLTAKLVCSYTFRANSKNAIISEIDVSMENVGKHIEAAARTSVKDRFQDARDGQIYRMVKIGNQTWMAENLNFATTGSYCYENQESNCQKYGRYYKWAEAKNACPAGWRLPEGKDFKNLQDYVGKNLGRKLKSKSGWQNNGNGQDVYGFSAMGVGGMDPKGGFDKTLGEYVAFWSSTPFKLKSAYLLNLISDKDEFEWFPAEKNYGFSVRCIKNN